MIVTGPGHEVGFPTSGHTADPVVWVRTTAALRAEVELVAAVALGPVEQVVTFAPRNHLYGHLFGEVLPAVLGVDVVDMSADPLAAAPFVPGRRTLYVCLPSSWRVLRGSVRAGASLTGSMALHSTGPVTTAAARSVRELTARGLAAVELFGATETGGIAYRALGGGPTPPWQLLPDVTLVDAAGPDGTCLLHVRSPRIARRADQPAAAPTHRLADTIRPLGAGRFLHLGRSTRLIKINGKRCDLAAIEDALATAVPGIDAVCVGVRDQVRGEHYELFYAGAPDDSAARLAAALARFPSPRTVHRVDRVPRTITGKVMLDRLVAMTGAGARR
jgi:acyl-coenzyme A synthetase/AMP-(fatty) acid ligase